MVPFLRWSLSAADQQHLSNAHAELKRVVDAVKLAQGSAGRGTGALTGSKAKLTAIRLQSAKSGIPRVKGLLSRLPQDHPNVAALQGSLVQVEAAVAGLEARLGGGGKGAAVASSPAKGDRLDYKQEAVLKNAQFSLREVEGNVAALDQLLAKIKPTEDRTRIDHRLVQRGMNTLANAERKAGFARDALEQLPPAGTGVTAANQRLGQARASLSSTRAYLEPLAEELAWVIHPGSYPTLKDDLKRLQGLASMLARVEVFEENRDQAGASFMQAPQARQEAIRIYKTYEVLVHQGTEDGKRVHSTATGFEQNYQRFMARAGELKTALPADMDADLRRVKEMADEAVREQKPLWFTGGIPQQMGFVREKLSLYAAIDPAGAAKYQGRVDAATADLAKRENSLKDLVIRTNELPPDRFSGADRGKLVQAAGAAWTKKQPGAQIIAARIPSSNWKRERMWRLQNTTWYFIDRSKLQVQLLVKHDGRLAVIRPINLWIDHLQADELRAFPLLEVADELTPSSYLLLEKVQ